MRDKIVLFLALILPCIPKIQLFQDIYIYPFELVMILFFFQVYYKYIKFPIQKDMLIIWLIIALSTIISFVSEVSIGGLFRCFKEIIYIPLLYMAFKSKELDFNHLLNIFIVAFVFNFAYIVNMGFSFSNIAIWQSEFMSSGFSNKVFNFSSWSIEQRESAGAHGVWGNYCVLMACVALFSYSMQKISKFKFLLVLICVLLNFAMSTSREALLTFGVLIIFYFYSLLFSSGKGLILNWKAMIVLFIFIIGISYIVSHFADKIAIIEKLNYMANNTSSKQFDGNFQCRVNTWFVIFSSYFYYPLMFFIGYGNNRLFFENFLDFPEASNRDSYITTPESFFVEMLFFGGIVCLFFGIRFWKNLYTLIMSISSKQIKYIFCGLFWGLLLGNLISGASVISDVLYSQLFIVMGLVYRDLIYTNNKIKEKAC